ncbi:MAG: TlpA family protein disulfide reductase [Acidimicrobiales bacterium]
MTSTRAPRSRNSAVAKAQKAGQGSRTVWIVAAVGLVVVLSGILAFALSQEESPGEVRASQVGTVDISGSILPPLPQGAPSQAIGMAAPEVTGEALDGGSFDIANDGTPKVIGFFTHWCPACQAEVPVVSSWAAGGGLPDDVDFIAVNTGVNPGNVNYPPSAWYERENWTIPTLLDSSRNEVATAFGLSAYPFWVVVDADGVVVDQLSGQLGIDQIETLIEMARRGGEGTGVEGGDATDADAEVEQ